MPPSPLSFLSWLPNETLFSVISRLHILWGWSEPSITNHALFDRQRVGSQHDLPSGLGALARNPSMRFGDVESIATERTLFRYYRRFLTEEDERTSITEMSGTNVHHLKFRLGIIASRFRANHPLKACSTCMRLDVERYGWSYWHIQHQYPGVWLCPDHGIPLQESTQKSTGIGRFQWLLPKMEELRPWPVELHSTFDAERSFLKKLAKIICDLIDAPQYPARFSATDLLKTYRLELERRGWATKGGNLKLLPIAESYLQYANRLRFIPEFQALPENLDSSTAQIGRLLRPMRSRTHPLRHFHTIHWLFGDASNFLHSFHIATSSASIDNGPERSSEYALSLPTKLGFEQLQIFNHPLPSTQPVIAGEGLDIPLDKNIRDIRIQTKHCSKRSLDELKKAVTQALLMGTNEDEVAKKFNLPTTVVAELFHSEVGFYNTKHATEYTKIRAGHRATWLQVLESHGALGIKAMRSEVPASYIWLYRHDQKWWDEHKPAPLSRSHKLKHIQALWDERDTTLNSQVKEAALALAQSGCKRIFRWQLYQAVPELKAKLTALDRLPLTTRTIKQILVWRLDEKSYPLPLG